MQEPRVHEFFDAYARDFDAIYGNRNTPTNRLINQLFRKSMRLRYERTIAGCQPIAGASVIDIGCGPGHYSVELARRGAERVLGVDFSPAMIDLAKAHAQKAGVADRCEFRVADFYSLGETETFDFSIVMGFMDYIAHAKPLIERVLSITSRKAFFSFPLDGGALAWQRKLRYRRRCELHLYQLAGLQDLFASIPHEGCRIERISRDALVELVPQHKSWSAEAA